MNKEIALDEKIFEFGKESKTCSHIHTEDVKEFIKRLKEIYQKEIFKKFHGFGVSEMVIETEKKIDKLAGEKLT